MTAPGSGVFAFAWPALVPLAGCGLTLALGLFVASRRGAPALRRSFAALNVAVALWNLDVFLLFTVRDRDLAALLDRCLQLPIVFIPFLALLFIFSFLGRRFTHPLLLASAAASTLLWALSWSPRYLAGWRRFWFGWYGTPGELYPLFVATLLAYLAVSTAVLVREARATRDHLRRSQALYLLLGNLVLGLSSLTNFLPLWGVPILPLGNLASVAYVGLMAVTITRHRLLPAEVIFRAGMLYSALTFCLSALYIALLLGLQRWFQNEVFAGSLLLPMLPAIAAGLAVSPLKTALQERLDRTFFRSRAQMRARLAEFADVLGRLEREEEIWRAAWEAGWRHAHAEKGVVLLGAAGELTALREHRTTAEERERGAAILAELRAPRRLAPGEPFEVGVPVIGRDGLLGGALAGPKAGGGLWSEEDLKFFGAIAAQTALAVERARLDARVRREERLAVLGRAAAVISHEMRNPLNVMRGAVAVMRSRSPAGEAPPELNVVESEINRGDRFIRDVLWACRERRPHRCRIDLALVLREFAAAWEGGEFAQVRLALDVAAGGLPVHGDAFQLRELVENLARNAAEASGGRGLVTVRAERLRDGTAVVAVEDEGPGIPPAVLPGLFEPFRTTKPGGTGLGLSIAKGIVEGHGGRIAAANRPQGGAVFRVWIPEEDEKRTGEVA